MEVKIFVYELNENSTFVGSDGYIDLQALPSPSYSNTIPNPFSLRNFGAPPEIFQDFFLMIWDNFNFPVGLGYRETVLQG